MSLSRAQVREQMVDYLYGELQGEALAAFEAALRESEQSRRELAELQAMLRATRGELARDKAAQPPARVRDAVLKAAEDAAQRDAPPPARVIDAMPQRSALSSALRWLRSVWILPPLIAAAAAALLVFRKEQPPAESAHTQPTSHVAEPEAPGAPEGSTPGAATPQAEAPPPPAPESRSARSKSREQYATPPADWRRSRSADTRARAPAATTGESAPTREEQASGGGLGSAERRAAAAPQAPEALDPDTTLSSDGLRTAAPSSAPSARPSAEVRSAAPAPVPLTAANLERRARAHAAADRWAQAAADYRELLRRFPQDPRRKLWTEQLELALRAAEQAATKQ